MTKPKTIFDGTRCVRCKGSILGKFSAPATSGSVGEWCEPCYTFMTGLDRYGSRVAGKVSIDELKAELARREEAAAQAERVEKSEAGDRIMQNLDALLLLVPDHTLEHCSDENNYGWDKARCTRCVLIQAEADGDWRNDTNLSITAEHDANHRSF